MTQLKRILAATDLSAPARHAVERAALVSQDTASALDMVHVARLTSLERLRQLVGATPATLEQRVLDAARQKLHELAATVHQRFGIVAGTHVHAGALVTELARKSEDLGIDLLACGARGESIVRHFMLGTTALRLLSTASCPVLVVKQPAHESYRRLLVPVDFSSSSLRAIRHARRIAPRAELVLLHAYDPLFEGHLRYASVEERIIHHYRTVARKEANQRLQALREQAGLDVHEASLVVLHGDPGSCIVTQEQEQDCDLIVMGKHGESLVERLLLGSVTKHVLARSRGDILVSL
jgi:nucleotide-binding universal stress UspA family protein